MQLSINNIYSTAVFYFYIISNIDRIFISHCAALPPSSRGESALTFSPISVSARSITLTNNRDKLIKKPQIIL